MFAFVIYALVVWYAAFRWRRRWPAIASMMLGVLGIATVAYLHHLLGVWSESRIQVVVFQSLLYPYAGLVVLVGAYLAWLPQMLRSAVRCLNCNYDMRGLEDDPEVVCPECGRRLNPPRHAAIRINPETPATPRRPAGPDPVVLRWPPVESPGAVPATDL